MTFADNMVAICFQTFHGIVRNFYAANTSDWH